VCKCHQRRKAAIEAGMSWDDANRKFSKPLYHEHRCECTCGCKHDTLGYAYCPSCHFDAGCLEKRGQVLGVLALPFSEK
jgi:hypothetical protein